MAYSEVVIANHRCGLFRQGLQRWAKRGKGSAVNILTRRRFLQIAGFAALGATAGLAGCGESRNAADMSPAASASSGGVSSGNATPATQNGASLVLVFSRAGENYGVGTVKVGNTMVLAQMIAQKTGPTCSRSSALSPIPRPMTRAATRHSRKRTLMRARSWCRCRTCRATTPYT